VIDFGSAGKFRKARASPGTSKKKFLLIHWKATRERRRGKIGRKKGTVHIGELLGLLQLRPKGLGGDRRRKEKEGSTYA